MKKKLFTLMTLLLCLCSTAWATDTYYLQDPDKVNGTPALKSDFLIGNLTLNQSTTATIGSITFKKAIKFGSSLSSISGKNAGDNNICYDVKTTSTKFTVYVSGGTGTLYFSKIAEGGTSTTVENKTISSNPQKLEFTFNSTTNTKVGFSVSNTSMYIYQIIAEETGTAHKMAGEAGYELNLNKGRYTGDKASSNSGKSGKVDNIEIVSYSSYTCTNSTALELTKNSADTYLKFTTGASACKIKVTYSAGTLIANSSKSTTGGIALTSNTAADLAANTTYYIINTNTGNRATITKLVFEASAAPTKYDVTYHANGSGEDDVVNNVSTVEDNMFTWAGHAFTGWNTAADGSGDDYAVGDAVTTNLTLWAQWEAETYTVTIAKNENSYGSVTSASVVDIPYNTTISASGNVLSVGTTDITATPAAATAEYTYAFNNWTGIPDGNKVTDNVTVTANFTRTPVNYTLSWNKNAEDADDLTGTYTTGTVAFGTAITTPNPPTRTGYTFQGWAETADGDVVEVPATMPAADKSYYAKWAVYVAPTAGVLFSADVTATSNQSFSSGTTEVTSSQATITGGRVYAVNGQDSGKNIIATQSNVGYFCMTNNNTIFKIVLNDPLAEGDVITANGIGGTKSGDSYNKGLWVSSSDSRPTSVPACSGTSATESLQTPILNYTVTSDDEYVGKTTLYIHRAAGSSTYFDNVVITRKNSITLNNVSGAAYGFSTFCSPNNFTVTGATAYKASLDEGKLTLTALSGIIPAGAGVILAADKGATASIAYTSSAATADMDGNALSGTTARTLTSTLMSGYTYFYAFQNTTNTFKQYDGKFFPANKAYVVSNAQLSRGISMDFGETTGISNVDVNANDNFDVNAPMYNLAGQKVGKSYKGIVIVNGKKYVRK